MIEMNVIPNKITIGGQDIDIVLEERLEEGLLGECCLSEGVIRIADKFGTRASSPSSKVNTFWHETVHAILDTMGEGELSHNEKFVSCFAGFLSEAIRSMKFFTEEETEDGTTT